jgi:hypothetical protein
VLVFNSAWATVSNMLTLKVEPAGTPSIGLSLGGGSGGTFGYLGNGVIYQSGANSVPTTGSMTIDADL